jgi:hypothetical protein
MRIDPVAVYPATEAELERWVGSYELVSPRHEIFAFLDRLLMTAHIERGEHGLRLRLGIGPAVPLVAVAPDQLTLPGFSGPVLQLDADGDLLLGDSSYARRPAALLTARALAVTWSIRIVAFAPLVFALLMLGKRRTSTSRALASPLAAVAGLWLLTLAFVIGLRADVLGHVHPWTVLLFVASLFAPAAAGLALARSIRGLCGTPPALARASALLVSAACFVLVVWLHAGHFVALRTWAW